MGKRPSRWCQCKQPQGWERTTSTRLLNSVQSLWFLGEEQLSRRSPGAQPFTPACSTRASNSAAQQEESTVHTLPRARQGEEDFLSPEKRRRLFKMKLPGCRRAGDSKMQTRHLPLPLLLLLLIPAGSTEITGPIDVDLAPGSFDDQYHGCHQRTAEALAQGDYFTQEVEAHKNYSRLWQRAHLTWLSHASPLPRGLTPTHAVALWLYTSDATVRSDFSRALAQDAGSPRQYQSSFHFKFLHFYLTSAVQLLRAGDASCHRAHHAVDFVLEANVGATLRFGQFLSAAPVSGEARGPVPHTLLTLVTCLGTPVHQFSLKDRVLIPPYEVFEIVNRSHQQRGERWFLQSAGNRSAYNCQLLKASGRQPAPAPALLAWLSCFVGLWGLSQSSV
ncbi:ecto-ADP-ribosyltransferase 4 [Thomomys bottae]